MTKVNYDLVCMSHLRWNWVFQRPQHLMTRAAKERRVVFFEEPEFDPEGPRLETREESGVLVAVPKLPGGLSEAQVHAHTRALLEGLLAREGIQDYVLWVYSPMTMPALRSLSPKAVVYDCMDELANFRFAPPSLRQRERDLFVWADLVFTGGHRLYEAKRLQHAHVHPFPSSVDVAHFATARGSLPEPADMAGIPHPRVGLYGVIDERFDIDLLGAVASERPDWHFVMLGPTAKIDPADLPKAKNIHYLGQKSYAELPAYLAHWDAAILPFALNESTEFISPTKTPEYLAAGKPVVSTPIRDVVRPYGEQDLVLIGRTPEEFTAALEEALADPPERRARADAYVGRMSWDKTWRQMDRLIREALRPATSPVGALEPSVARPVVPVPSRVAAPGDSGLD